MRWDTSTRGVNVVKFLEDVAAGARCSFAAETLGLSKGCDAVFVVLSESTLGDINVGHF